ncbi:hypothetical protein C8D97_101219 [Pleionea mediterranea]|uniref:Uncharacterized protein n=1 Tax=Pleionea mediterranea TaxID=523701 RepID=A0A316G0D7_9GAMM|nr:hypothetical protein C8D97_101219 [Pleionea mediterranea]
MSSQTKKASCKSIRASIQVEVGRQAANIMHEDAGHSGHYKLGLPLTLIFCVVSISGLFRVIEFFQAGLMIESKLTHHANNFRMSTRTSIVNRGYLAN